MVKFLSIFSASSYSDKPGALHCDLPGVSLAEVLAGLSVELAAMYNDQARNQASSYAERTE